MTSPTINARSSRTIRMILLSISLIALLMFGLTAFFLTRQPSGPPLPLPKGMISLHSTLGQQLLKESNAKANFHALHNALETQSRPAYCGVASAVTILNASYQKKALTQSTFFHPAARAFLSPFWVTLRGMELDELHGLLKSHQIRIKTHHANTLNLSTFRKLTRQTLAQKNTFLLLNYLRKTLKQKGEGHISPLAAYHQKTDRALLLDVATYKYPPHWIKLPLLWKATNTHDHSSGKTRGLLIAQP